MGEPLADAVRNGALQRVVVEDRRRQEGAERGVALDRLLRLDADAGEQRIVGTEPDQFGDMRHRTLPVRARYFTTGPVRCEAAAFVLS